MIIKSFTAPTIASALKRIREEMGGQAIVLKTRTCTREELVKTGHQIEVTACIDELFAKKTLVNKSEQSSSVSTEPEIFKQSSDSRMSIPSENRGDFGLTDVEKSLESIIKARSRSIISDDCVGDRPRPLVKNLLDSDIPIEIVNNLIEEVSKNTASDDRTYDNAGQVLRDKIASFISPDVRLRKGSKIVFIGASGTGKTSVMGKVAAQLCAESKQKLKLLSLDNMKMYSQEEVDAYGKILDVSIESNVDIDTDGSDDMIVLIDTPSIRPNEKDNDKLLKKIEAIKADVVFLVFSARSRSADLVELIDTYSRFSPTYLIASHLDETDRWGGIVTMAEYMKIPIAFVTDTPGGMGQLSHPDPTILADCLMRMEVQKYDQ